jgi:hypothetical protein
MRISRAASSEHHEHHKARTLTGPSPPLPASACDDQRCRAVCTAGRFSGGGDCEQRPGGPAGRGGKRGTAGDSRTPLVRPPLPSALTIAAPRWLCRSSLSSSRRPVGRRPESELRPARSRPAREQVPGQSTQGREHARYCRTARQLERLVKDQTVCSNVDANHAR